MVVLLDLNLVFGELHRNLHVRVNIMSHDGPFPQNGPPHGFLTSDD